MKWIKRAVAALVILGLFVITALVAILVYIDPNDYKDQIIDLVAEHTGRTLHIDGDIGLSVFPWIGLELNQVGLDNPPGFADKRFAEMGRLNIKVALMPLFAMQIRIGEIQLLGLRVNAQRRADGVANWDDLLADDASSPVPSAPAAEAQPTPAEPATAPASELPALALQAFYIGGINIDDANITWRDATTDTLTHIEHFEFKTGVLRLNKPTDFSVNFSLRNEQPKIIAGIEMTGSIRADLDAARYALNNLDIAIRASGPTIPGNDQQLSISLASVAVDLSTESLKLDSLMLNAVGAEINTSLQASQIMGEQLQASGQLDVNIASLRNLMSRLEIPAPITAEEDVLGKMVLQAKFTAGLDDLAITNLQLLIDNSQLNGELAVKQFAQPVVRFKLAMDSMDADSYMPPVSETELAAESAAAPVVSTAEAAALDPEIELPVEMMRELDVQGNFKLAALKAMNLNLSNLNVALQAKDGVIALKPISLDLYKGQFRGQAQLDVTQATPKMAAAFKLAQVQAGPLIQDYMNDRLLEGEMGATADITTKGVRISEYMQQLNGEVEVAFKDGALSMNVREKLQEAKTKLKQKLGGGQAATVKSLGEPTKFSSITASMKIVDGTVNNDDLEVRARHLFVSGAGKFELPTNYIDYVLTLLLSDDGAGQDDQLGDFYDLPIKFPLKGKLEELDYASIAVKALSSAVSARLKWELDDKKAAAKAGLERKQAALEKAKKEELARKKAEVKAELERKKKAAEENKKKELEDKLKNKLKDLF